MTYLQNERRLTASALVVALSLTLTFCGSFDSKNEATPANATNDAAMDASPTTEAGPPTPGEEAGPDASSPPGACAPEDGWRVQPAGFGETGAISVTLDENETLAVLGAFESPTLTAFTRSSKTAEWTASPGLVSGVNTALGDVFRSHVALSHDTLKLAVAHDTALSNAVGVFERASISAAFAATETLATSEASHPYYFGEPETLYVTRTKPPFGPMGLEAISIVDGEGVSVGSTVGVVLFSNDDGVSLLYSPESSRSIELARRISTSSFLRAGAVPGLWCQPGARRFANWANANGKVVYFVEGPDSSYASFHVYRAEHD